MGSAYPDAPARAGTVPARAKEEGGMNAICSFHALNAEENHPMKPSAAQDAGHIFWTAKTLLLGLHAPPSILDYVGIARPSVPCLEVIGAQKPMSPYNPRNQGKCPTCWGHGRVENRETFLAKLLHLKRQCQDCQGTGKCPVCNGTGKWVSPHPRFPNL
jgi:hypothetical protein